MQNKDKYPVNQLQMSRTDTMGAVPAGYGAGNLDPHQLGYMGETASNGSFNYKQKKRPTKGPFYKRYGGGNFPNYPEA